MRQIHALTPGDHFSPRTGSAVATVIHGLATHTDPRPAVLVAAGTYADRYGSADALEYPLHHASHTTPRRTKALDVALGSATLRRPWARRVHRQLVVAQDSWDPSYVIAHNAPQLVPLIDHRHAPVLYVHNNLLDRYTTREASHVLRSVHRVICVSQYTADQTTRKLERSLHGRVRVVPNGIDVHPFGLPRIPRDHALRVGFLGRVIPEKGVHILLEAVAKLHRTDLAVQIVGSAGFDAGTPLTAYENELRRRANGLSATVEFVPFQPRAALPALLSAFDVMVIPSVAPEAFPLTVLEGMAARCVVVASEIGGVPEAAGDAAFLFPPGDVDALASMLEGLADDSALVDDVARRGQERARTMTWKKAADRLVRALQH